MTKSVSSQRRDGVATRMPILQDYYRTLFEAHGPQHWWPGRGRFEVIVGAILVQNTAWKNVVTAIRNLRGAKLLTPAAMHAADLAKVEELIRPSGYFRQKAKKLKAFLQFLYGEYGGSPTKMLSMPTTVLREQLLSIHGIGQETADSILLYAGGHAVFVVDGYARRILERHGLAPATQSYEDLRRLFEASLPTEPQLFNEFHALVVRTGKEFCRKSEARCAQCSLKKFLPGGRPR